MHVRFGSIFVSVISAIGLVEASNYTIPQAAGRTITSGPLITASPEPDARFSTSCNASCAAAVTRPTYNSSDFWISISYTSGSHYAESGPVVHSTVTEGLHPDPTTTEQAVGVVTGSKEVGGYRVTLPFFGPFGPGPTGEASPSQTEQNQGTGSEPAVALPITQSTDHSTTDVKSSTQIIVSGESYTANPSSQLMIGSQAVQPGGPAITHGQPTTSPDPSPSNIIIDSSTYTTSHLLPKTTLTPNTALVLTLDDQPVTANSASEYIIGSQTLIPGGPAVTLSGTRISLAPSASSIIIGSSTEALGPIIIGGFGPSNTATSPGPGNPNVTGYTTATGYANATTTGAEAFTGGGTRPAAKELSSWWSGASFLVVIGLVVVG